MGKHYLILIPFVDQVHAMSYFTFIYRHLFVRKANDKREKVCVNIEEMILYSELFEVFASSNDGSEYRLCFGDRKDFEFSLELFTNDTFKIVAI